MQLVHIKDANEIEFLHSSTNAKEKNAQHDSKRKKI